MTTNKPEIVAWKVRDEIFYSKDDAVEASAFHSRHCDLEPLIRLSDYEDMQAECEELRKASSELANWCFHVVGVDIEHAPGLKQVVDITGVVYDKE